MALCAKGARDWVDVVDENLGVEKLENSLRLRVLFHQVETRLGFHEFNLQSKARKQT